MANITALSDLLNWKLRRGSHDWPGPDGGTCINEAAIVAAGFPYRSVQSAADCPPCFSPVVSAYLIRLNDDLSDADRQLLLPFVMRLAGSAGSPDIESQRLEYIVVETVRQIISSVLDAADMPAESARCRAVVTFDEASRAARAAMEAMEASVASVASVARAASIAIINSG